MRPRFKVRLLSFEEIHALPEAWQRSDYRDILAALEFDDVREVSDEEAMELCLMALADMEPEAAARAVLQHRLGKTLRKGQIDDVAQDMVDQPLWEDYPEMRVHEELYNYPDRTQAPKGD